MTIDARLHRAPGALTTLDNGRHAWITDMPVGAVPGSPPVGPDPHDLLDAALAACTTLTLELYIRRKQLPVTDLAVTIEHVEEKAADGRVLYRLQRRIAITGELADADRQRLMEIADRCPIHRILTGQIEIATTAG
jgi:putative redox protein